MSIKQTLICVLVIHQYETNYCKTQRLKPTINILYDFMDFSGQEFGSVYYGGVTLGEVSHVVTVNVSQDGLSSQA